MKIIIIAIGKEKDFEGRDMVDDYTDRISHYCDCEWRYIHTDSARRDNDKIIGILEKEKTGSYVIALDEIGRDFTSQKFAENIQSRMNESVQKLFFIIGGSYGLSDEVRNRAHMVMNLSKLTFPHQMVRLILIEQIYRAFTIIKGEKYHH